MPTEVRTSVGARADALTGSPILIVRFGSPRIALRAPIEPLPQGSGVLSAGGTGGFGLVAGGFVNGVLNAGGVGAASFSAGGFIGGALGASGAGSTSLQRSSTVGGALGVSGSGAFMAANATYSSGALSGSASGIMTLAAAMTKAAVLAGSGLGLLSGVGRAFRAATLSATGVGTPALTSPTAGATVDFINRAAIDVSTLPAYALAAYSIGADGIDRSAPEADRTWLTSGSNGQVQIRAIETTGSVTLGPIGTWETPTSNLEWTKSRTSDLPGSSAVTLSMQCRRVSDLVVIDSWTVTITAETT